MTSPHSSAFDIRHPWFAGGTLLIATVVIDNGQQTTGGVLGPILFAVSLVVFALGSRTASVAARRPLGTTALILLGAWVLGESVAIDLLSGSAPSDALTVVATIDPFVRFALALIAVVQIGRAATVPSPWNWAPAWALAAVTVPWLVGVVFAAVLSGTDMTVLLTLTAIDGLVRSASAVFVGVLAIVLADRSSRQRAPMEPAPLNAQPQTH